MSASIESSTVSSPARLHLGLHDCGYASRRLFGGIGVIIDGFDTTVETTVSEQPEVVFNDVLNPSPRTIDAVHSLVNRLQTSVGPVRASIHTASPEHMGLGSKTSLLLAIAQSAFLSYGRAAGEDWTEIVKVTGRGGTSGIGVNGFRTGGLIIDGGHEAPDNSREFSPSSGRTPSRTAPVLAHAAMPEEWGLQLFIDPDFQSVEGAKEQALFKELMPLPKEEILKSMAATFHGVLPAVIEHNLAALTVGLRDLNTTGMKQRELALQTDNTRHFVDSAWSKGLAAGLSSFGPTTFVISEPGSEQHQTSQELADTCGLEYMGAHSFNNVGARAYDSRII